MPTITVLFTGILDKPVLYHTITVTLADVKNEVSFKAPMTKQI
jgi:hypothetical protein